MKTKSGEKAFPWQLFTVINFALLASALGLGLAAFFQSLEIVLTLAAPMILQSMGDTVRAKYLLVTLRNVWLLVGGVILLVVIIYCINSFFNRWRETRIQRVYILALALDLLIILAARIIVIA